MLKDIQSEKLCQIRSDPGNKHKTGSERCFQHQIQHPAEQPNSVRSREFLPTSWSSSWKTFSCRMRSSAAGYWPSRQPACTTAERHSLMIVIPKEVVTFAKNTDSRLNIRVNPHAHRSRESACSSLIPTQLAPAIPKNTSTPTSPKWASRWKARPARFTELRATTCWKKSAATWTSKSSTQVTSLGC